MKSHFYRILKAKMKVKQIQWGFYSDALTSYESIKIMLFFFFLLFLPPLHFCPQAGLLLPRRLHRSPINPAVNHALDSSVGLFLCPSVCISLLSTIFHIISWEPLPTFSHSVLLFYQLFISIHASSLINPGFPSCVFSFLILSILCLSQQNSVLFNCLVFYVNDASRYFN